jgi:hypothetical protein
VNKLFWGIAAVETAFFVVAFVMTANEGGHNDGGKGMALVFQIGLPFLLLAIVSLIYWRTSSPVLHAILLIVLVVPIVLLAGQWMRGPLMDRDIAVGGFIYKDSKMKSLVAAVSKMDETNVRRLAPEVDVNAVGELGMTPLKFAIEKVDSAAPEQVAARMDMIRVLLSVGAKPDSALPTACGARHDEITQVLLEAGANPNYKDDEGTPAFFFCGAGKPGSLTGLGFFADKGADFNAVNAQGESALIYAATFSQWEKMLFLLDHGAKDTPAPNGKTAAGIVADAMAADKQNSRDTVAALRELAVRFGVR